MTTFTVTTADDVVSGTDGKLSLREAVTQANATAAADKIDLTGIDADTTTAGSQAFAGSAATP